MSPSPEGFEGFQPVKVKLFTEGPDKLRDQIPFAADLAKVNNLVSKAILAAIADPEQLARLDNNLNAVGMSASHFNVAEDENLDAILGIVKQLASTQDPKERNRLGAQLSRLL